MGGGDLLLSMDLDVVSSIVEHLDVIDKLRLAGLCTRLRLALAPLFEQWDRELAWLVARTLEPSPGFEMTPLPEIEESWRPMRRRRWMTTTRPDVDPILSYKHCHGRRHAFEHGHVTAAVRYASHPFDRPRVHGDKPVRLARPRLQDPLFEPLRATQHLPNASIRWTQHPATDRPGVGYLLGDPVETPECVTFVRRDVVVSGEISTANARVHLECMGVAMPERKFFDLPTAAARHHINLAELRIYVAPPTVTEAMRTRAERVGGLRKRARAA